MNYGLTINKRGLDPFTITGLNSLTGDENISDKRLDDIVNFTNGFNSEEELTKFLIEAGNLEPEYAGGHFEIIKLASGEALHYGVSYSEDKKFFDLDYLREYYISKFTDTRFMNGFLNRYLPYLGNVDYFRNLLNGINTAYNHYVQTGEKAYEYSTHIYNFITSYATTTDRNGNPKQSVSRIRELAMFAVNYERTYNRNPQKNKYSDPNYINNLKLELDYYNQLITNPEISFEAYTAYIKKIEELQKEFDYFNTKNLRRTRENK